MKPEQLQIEYRSTESLIPYARNSRTHSDEQIAQVAASMQEFGWTNPILVDGANGIIAGHGRVLAARKLGMEQVPVIELRHLSEAQKRAYVIADNKLAEQAGWDEEILKLEFADLQALDFDMELTGFSDDEINDLLGLNEPTSGNTDADAVPEVKAKEITRTGDVWLLGSHRVMCGDSTSAKDVATLMNNQIATLVHADPPYGMGKQSDGVENDNLYREKLDAFQMQWWKAFRPHLADNASAYIWGNAPDLWRLWYVGGLSESERMTLRNQIVWDKKHGMGMSSGDFRSYAITTEHCLLFMLGEQEFNDNADNYWEGWESIRSYLDDERKKMNWTYPQVSEICGCSARMSTHWMTKSQFAFIRQEHYEKLQAASGGAAFRRDYDALRRDYDALRRDFYSTRAYFDNAHDNMRDVWEFPRVVGDERHDHATPKPVAMMERL